jgi:integrase/recombinase XerD
MKKPIVRLKLRVRLPDGSRPYLEPVFTANKKLKPGYPRHHGQNGHWPDGVYHLRYLKGGRRIWEAVGSDAQLAQTKLMQRERILTAKAAGIDVVEPLEDAPGTDLKVAITEYLDEVATHKSKKTSAAYSLTLELFQQSCAKRTLEEITLRIQSRRMQKAEQAAMNLVGA